MRKPPATATAFAPATSGNMGVGFDVLGICLKSIGDTVSVTRTDRCGIIEIMGARNSGIPTEPEKNTATAGLLHMLRDLELPMGFQVRIRKGIPLGSGMGGSAASAVAGVVAASALLDKPLTENERLKYALLGEAVASGSMHADNVAPCLLGGLVLIPPTRPLQVIRIPFPRELLLVVALPHARLDTRKARGILKRHVKLQDFVCQAGYLSAFLAGCFRGDTRLIGESFRDVVIEPQRARLIPGFHEVQAAAIEAGALGCTISGAGPAVLALATKNCAPRVKRRMLEAFRRAGAGPARGWIAPVNLEGARLL